MVMTSVFRHPIGIIAVLGAALLLAGCQNAPKVGAGPPGIPPKSILAMGPAPVTGSAASFAFEPITSTPAEVVGIVSKTITREAAARKIRVLPLDDPNAIYIVKGYLSAIGDGNATTLVYVWDVFDRSGARLHRISGQEPGKGSDTDPWVGISKGNVETAASRTVDDLAAWISPGRV